MVELEVMICTYGREGILRVAGSCHPQVEGVRYLVSWQMDEGASLPTELLRDDFRIVRSETKGLSVNRNIALSHASAPLLLISDDDVSYDPEGLRTVIDSFRMHPDIDLIAFRFVSGTGGKIYPEQQYSINQKFAKGHYISSIELAFRKDSVKGKIRMNEFFGIGATFPCGEEEIFVWDCLDKGLRCMYIPKDIATHKTSTTSERTLMSPGRAQTKGAIFLRLHPFSWPLRMIVHAIRDIPLWRAGKASSPLSFCLNWIKGTHMAKKLHVFPTPDNNSPYDSHE